MFDPVIQVIILAAIALFVLFRLYTVLGRGEGDNDIRRTEPSARRAESDAATVDAPLTMTDADVPVFTGPAAAGLEEIYNADRSFSEAGFMRGARAAYSMIVSAYAEGNRETLRPLLDDDVYEAWDAAIAERETTGAPAFELLRIRRAEIESAELDGKTLVRHAVEAAQDADLVQTILVTGHMADRIEAGSYACAAAITGGEARLEGAKADDMSATLHALRNIGVHVESDAKGVHVAADGKLKAANLSTAPYPGLATDMQAQLMALLTVAEGTSVLEEKILREKSMTMFN